MYIMTNEEMVIQYQGGNKQALEQLLEANKGFIHKVSMKLYSDKDNAVSQEDLLQECRIGMIKAADRYKSDMANNFLTYAYYWMYQGMYRFMYPKRSMVNSRLKFVSLNVKVGDEEETELGDMLADDKDEFCNIEDSIYHQELNSEIQQLIEDNLTPQQRQVIYLRYGFNCNIHTFQEIGESLGVTSQRIKQIEAKSMRTLRTTRWAGKRIDEHNEEFKKRSAWEDEQRERRIKEREERWKQFKMGG